MNDTKSLRMITGGLAFAATGAFLIFIAASTAGIAKPRSMPSSMPKGERIAKGSNCFSCHAVSHKVVGPAFDAVAKKFAGQSGAKAKLVKAVKNGHVGTWGHVPMPPHPNLSKAKIGQVVSWILSLKPQSASAAPAGTKTYTYKINGKTVTTHVPIFKPGTHKVTKAVFRGYELFNSYCFRCHGEDAVGGMYAPNLRQSLNQGMKEQGFVTFAMEGKKSKGMPSWAGFFSPHQIRAIYAYVKGRAIGAISTGTPKH